MNLCLRTEGLNSSSISRCSFAIGSLGYFFISGDGWKTLFDEFWGEIPMLLCRWETSQIGVLSLVGKSHAYLFWSSFPNL